MDQRWVQIIETGKELDRAQRKSCATLCLLNDGSVWRIEEFIFQSFTQLTHEQCHDRSIDTQAWLSPSAKSVWHFTSFSLFFFFLYIMLAAEMQHYPTVLQRKTSIQCLEHTVSRTARACGEPSNLFFFLAQIIFYSPSRVAFGVLMWRETKKIITVALVSLFSRCGSFYSPEKTFLGQGEILINSKILEVFLFLQDIQ